MCCAGRPKVSAQHEICQETQREASEAEEGLSDGHTVNCDTL